jgi:NADH-quinone oxidoreductase subunit N
MAGIPPTAGFMGKLYIIVSAYQAGHTALAVLGIVSSVLSMWYYLRLIIAMYFQESEDQFEISNSPSAPICAFILAICVLMMSLYPVAV